MSNDAAADIMPLALDIYDAALHVLPHAMLITLRHAAALRLFIDMLMLCRPICYFYATLIFRQRCDYCCRY